MENPNFIYYHRTRDFGRKLNATFEFIRQNFKPLFKSILFIAGPPVLIGSLLLGSFMGDFMNFSIVSSKGGGPEAFRQYFLSIGFWAQMALMIVFLVVSGVMTTATINSYIILYEEKAGQKVDVHDVWQRVRETFWMYFGTMFFFALCGMLAYIIVLIPIVVLAQISVALVILSVMVLGGVMVYLLISVSLTFFVRGYEKIGFLDALARSFRLVQGKWWSTLGLIVILHMIMSFASYIFMIPWYAMWIVTMMHSIEAGSPAETSSTMQILMTVFFAFYYLAYTMLTSLPQIGVAFQYFNLVEMKESRGLMNSIESLGQTEQPSSTKQDEHY